MTAFKICGITREEDAVLAATLGAWAVGFVLWPKSPRHTTVDRVRDIVRELPRTVEPVGVFVDPSDRDIAEAVDAGVRIVQIHGTVPITGDLDPAPLVWQAVHLAADGTDTVEPAVSDRTIVLDAADPVQRGGTGRTIDWKRAAVVARSRQVILAGGLTPQNVAEAIRIVRPYAVDVASGVEAEPGIKDHGLLREFARAVKETM